MKWHQTPFGAVCLMLFVFNAPATVRYVDLNCATPTSPYISWDTAATNIQDAINVSAFSGDSIFVTNGVYETGASSNSGSNRVNVAKALMLQSVNGPTVTIIKGYQVPGTTNGASAIRCVYLVGGATLSGFTLTNGATQSSGAASILGGGIYCQATSAVVTNCVIAGNVSISSGGGVYQGTLVNCSIMGNLCRANGGGGVYSGTLNNCVIMSNTSALGGGVYSSTLTNCSLIGNGYSGPLLGWGGGAYNSTLVDCILNGNFATYRGVAAYSCTLVNCTIVNDVGGVDDIEGGVINNCIDYYNSIYIRYTSSFSSAVVFSNIPVFVDLAAGDFHLNAASPCINTGGNSFISIATDFDGNPRITGPTVDIGAYEYQYQAQGTFFVNLSNAQPGFPYQSWDTAATSIQDAIDAASAGSQIFVSNGVYRTGGRVVYGSLTNRVVVTRSLMVQSVNGAAVTSIEGYQVPGSTNGNSAIRCVYLTNGVVLDGFTLTNGATTATGFLTNKENGGAIWCESTNALIRNCVLIKNAAYSSAGGVYFGTLTNCTLRENSSLNGSSSDGGGGAANSLLNNCLISSNYAKYGGGGVVYSTLNSCTLKGNTTSVVSIYGGGGAASSTLNNCLVYGNSSSSAGGASYSALNNCTVISNSASSLGGGFYQCTVSNCIVYYNTAPSSSNYTTSTLIYCCTLPAAGTGCITNAPLFVNFAGGDFHLQSNSPCINAGNNKYTANATDLDGNLRIVGGTVDMGAYEFQSPSSTLSYAWAQQYGLPADGSADNTDSDGDGLSNWQEWKAGTNPTNAASVLQLLSPSNNVSGITVTWQSVAGVTYYLQSSTNLSAPPAFASIKSNLVGQAGTTSYTDTTATNGGPYFYRIGVQ